MPPPSSISDRHCLKIICEVKVNPQACRVGPMTTDKQRKEWSQTIFQASQWMVLKHKHKRKKEEEEDRGSTQVHVYHKQQTKKNIWHQNTELFKWVSRNSTCLDKPCNCKVSKPINSMTMTLFTAVFYSGHIQSQKILQSISHNVILSDYKPCCRFITNIDINSSGIPFNWIKS